MKVTTNMLKELLNLERYDYTDVIGASPYTHCELEGKNRKSIVVAWRQFVVTVARLQGLTYDDAGAVVCQDHATVIHSMRSVFERLNDKQYPEYRIVLDEIKKHIEFNIVYTDDICWNEINCIRMLEENFFKKFNI